VNAGTSKRAMMVAADTLCTNPRSTPAMSLMSSQPRSSMLPRMSGVFQSPIVPPARNGQSKRGSADFCGGDCVMPDP